MIVPHLSTALAVSCLLVYLCCPSINWHLYFYFYRNCEPLWSPDTEVSFISNGCIYVHVFAEEGLSLFVGPGGSTALGSQYTRWVWLYNRRLWVPRTRHIRQIYAHLRNAKCGFYLAHDWPSYCYFNHVKLLHFQLNWTLQHIVSFQKCVNTPQPDVISTLISCST